MLLCLGFLRKIYRTDEVGDLIANVTLLGLVTIPDDTSDEAWKE